MLFSGAPTTKAYAGLVEKSAAFVQETPFFGGDGKVIPDASALQNIFAPVSSTRFLSITAEVRGWAEVFSLVRVPFAESFVFGPDLIGGAGSNNSTDELDSTDDSGSHRQQWWKNSEQTALADVGNKCGRVRRRRLFDINSVFSECSVVIPAFAFDISFGKSRRTDEYKTYASFAASDSTFNCTTGVVLPRISYSFRPSAASELADMALRGDGKVEVYVNVTKSDLLRDLVAPFDARMFIFGPGADTRQFNLNLTTFSAPGLGSATSTRQLLTGTIGLNRTDTSPNVLKVLLGSDTSNPIASIDLLRAQVRGGCMVLVDGILLTYVYAENRHTPARALCKSRAKRELQP